MATKRKKTEIVQPPVKERKLGRHRAVGMCHWKGLIEIDPRIKGKLKLDTLIHEYFHHIAPQAPEDKVDRTSTVIADFLWQNGLRFIEKETSEQ